MATEMTERVQRPGIDPADPQATARCHPWMRGRLRSRAVPPRPDLPWLLSQVALELAAGHASAAAPVCSVAGGTLQEQEHEALRAAGTAGGVVPAPLGGRALVLSVIGSERSRVEAWLAGAAADAALVVFERLILRPAATVVGPELMRVQVARDTGRRLAGDVLAEAPTGRPLRSPRDRIEFWLALRAREPAL